VRMRIIDIA